MGKYTFFDKKRHRLAKRKPMKRIFAKSTVYLNTAYEININIFPGLNSAQVSMELFACREENIIRRMIKYEG